MQYKNPEDINDHQPIIRTSFFRFYEELNDFLPSEYFKKEIPFTFRGTTSVKNAVQNIGVPHTEIDLILVDQISVDFNYRIQGGEHISVYPVFETFDVSPLIRLRPKPLRKIRFVVDVNLGKLAKKLRLLGFDTHYTNDLQDEEIVKISLAEKRIILTRDIGILKNGKVTHGTYVRSDNPKVQLNEVIERLHLKNLFKPFSRCSQCNGQLKRIKKKLLQNRIPGDTLNYYRTFWECQGCRQIYWEGSHFVKIIGWLEKMSGEN